MRGSGTTREESGRQTRVHSIFLGSGNVSQRERSLHVVALPNVIFWREKLFPSFFCRCSLLLVFADVVVVVVSQGSVGNGFEAMGGEK